MKGNIVSLYIERPSIVKESVESHDIPVDVKYTYVCPVTFLHT